MTFMTAHPPSSPRPRMFDWRSKAAQRQGDMFPHSAQQAASAEALPAPPPPPHGLSMSSFDRVVPPFSPEHGPFFGNEVVAALRAALQASETSLSRAARELAIGREALEAERRRNDELEARARSLECAIATRDANLQQETSKVDCALEGERRRSALLTQQVQRLGQAVREAAKREEDLLTQLGTQTGRCRYDVDYHSAEATGMSARYNPIDPMRPWYQTNYSSINPSIDLSLESVSPYPLPPYNSISAAVAPLSTLTMMESSLPDRTKASMAEDLRSLVHSVRRRQDELSDMLPREQAEQCTGSAPALR